MQNRRVVYSQGCVTVMRARVAHAISIECTRKEEVVATLFRTHASMTLHAAFRRLLRPRHGVRKKEGSNEITEHMEEGVHATQCSPPCNLFIC